MKTFSQSLAFVVLAASAALCGPVQAYPWTPSQLQYEQEKPRGLPAVQEQRERFSRTYGGAFDEFNERRRCFANDLPYCY